MSRMQVSVREVFKEKKTVAMDALDAPARPLLLPLIMTQTHAIAAAALSQDRSFDHSSLGRHGLLMSDVCGGRGWR